MLRYEAPSVLRILSIRMTGVPAETSREPTYLLLDLVLYDGKTNHDHLV
jgi:hypothetical protein